MQKAENGKILYFSKAQFESIFCKQRRDSILRNVTKIFQFAFGKFLLDFFCN